LQNNRKNDREDRACGGLFGFVGKNSVRSTGAWPLVLCVLLGQQERSGFAGGADAVLGKFYDQVFHG